ncbi:MAG: conjugal transfer protein TraX [Acetatifactor sp.]|nr:conjugal transfer protein TraX [Acetatifactor sp.]
MSHTSSGGQETSTSQEWEGGISGSTVKLVGIITMLIDHFAAAVLLRYMYAGGWSDRMYALYTILRLVGRLGFPIFCFLLVEGFEKTRSKTKYALRLLLFALISEVPFDLAFSAKVLEFGYQNVYFTLFLGLLALCAYDYLDNHKLPIVAQWLLFIVGVVLFGARLRQYYVQHVLPLGDLFFMLGFCAICFFLAVMLIVYGLFMGWDGMRLIGMYLAVLCLFMIVADVMHTDYSGAGVMTITAIYVFRGSNILPMAAGCFVLTLMSSNEAAAFLSLIPVAKYNGKRGLKLKYFFYAFYPVHLLLLWLVAWRMGLGFIRVV